MSNEPRIDRDKVSNLVYVYGYGDVLEEMALLGNPTRKAIIYLLAMEGPLTLKEISIRLGLSPSTVLDHLRRLRAKGIISEAKDQPKKFKVEVYYKLDIPFFFTSELEELKKRLEPIINEYKNFMQRVINEVKSDVRKADLKCLKGESINIDAVTTSLILGLNSLVLSQLVPVSKIVYIVINDKD